MNSLFLRTASICAVLAALALQIDRAKADDKEKRCAVDPAAAQNGRTGFLAAFASTFFASDRCASARRVLAMLVRRDIPGGRELKPGEQLNVAEAERQLATASRNGEYVKELAAQQQRETDPQKRKFIEAVLLDSFEYTAARDLRLQQMTGVQ